MGISGMVQYGGYYTLPLHGSSFLKCEENVNSFHRLCFVTCLMTVATPLVQGALLKLYALLTQLTRQGIINTLLKKWGMNFHDQIHSLIRFFDKQCERSWQCFHIVFELGRFMTHGIAFACLQLTTSVWGESSLNDSHNESSTLVLSYCFEICRCIFASERWLRLDSLINYLHSLFTLMPSMSYGALCTNLNVLLMLSFCNVSDCAVLLSTEKIRQPSRVTELRRHGSLTKMYLHWDLFEEMCMRNKDKHSSWSTSQLQWSTTKELLIFWCFLSLCTCDAAHDLFWCLTSWVEHMGQ